MEMFKKKNKEKKEVSGRNRRHWKERILGVSFLFIIKHLHMGELKIYIWRGFW